MKNKFDRATDNFLHETIDALKIYDYDGSNVKWIGSKDGKYAIDWDEFIKIGNIDYDSGFGAAEIASDLVMVMIDGSWFSRHEYDGSEGWEYNKIPKTILNPKKFDRLCVRQNTNCSCGWETLEKINTS